MIAEAAGQAARKMQAELPEHPRLDMIVMRPRLARAARRQPELSPGHAGGMEGPQLRRPAPGPPHGEP